jgi:hypothetical protein
MDGAGNKGIGQRWQKQFATAILAWVPMGCF